MKKSIKLWLALAVVFLLAVAVPALVFLPGCNIKDDDSSTTDINKGTVTGTVTDASSGNAIENVTVTIVEKSAKAVISDESDAQGVYTLPNVAPGTQVITAKKSGYANYTGNVEVTAEATVTQDITMDAVETASISGTVTNGVDDAPVVGARVWIEDIQDYSDNSGNYTLNGVPTGNQVLRATMNTYTDYQLTLTIEEGSSITQGISMEEGNAPDPPAEDVANLYGRVNANNVGVSGATVNLFALSSKGKQTPTPSPSPTPDATTETGSDGTYAFEGITPGSYRLEVITDDYDKMTTTVNPSASENERVDTFNLTGGPSPSPSGTVSPTTSPTTSPTPGQGTTSICSYNTAGTTAPANNGINSINGKVDDAGAQVVFQSNQKLLAAHVGNNTQIYLWKANGATLTLVSKNTSGLEGDNNSMNPCISPDGTYIAYASDATNLVASDAGGFRDIFLYNIGNNSTTRISTKHSTPAVGANGNSDMPWLNNSTAGLGFFCVFESAASDFIPTAVTPAGQINIFRGKIDKTTDQIGSAAGDALLVSQLPASTGNGGVVAPRNCGTPRISRDGKFVVYESDDDSLVATVPSTVNQVNIYHCDTSKTVATWTKRASQDNTGTSTVTGAANPSVSDNGQYVAFEDASNIWSGNAGVSDCYRADINSSGIDPVSGLPGGAAGASHNPFISADGTLVVFDSASTGLVENDKNASVDVFVRDMTQGKGSTAAYTRVSVNSNGEQAQNTSAKVNPGSINPHMSGSYVVFQSSATNLVSATGLGPDNYNVYMRKWK